MGDETLWGEAVRRTKNASPLTTAGVSGALVLALSQGIPLVLDYMREESGRETAAFNGHIETLGRRLESCEIERQEAQRRLREVLANLADVPVSATMPDID